MESLNCRYTSKCGVTNCFFDWCPDLCRSDSVLSLHSTQGGQQTVVTALLFELYISLKSSAQRPVYVIELSIC